MKMKYKKGDRFIYHKQTVEIFEVVEAAELYRVKLGCCRRATITEEFIDTLTPLPQTPTDEAIQFPRTCQLESQGPVTQEVIDEINQSRKY